MYWINTTIFHFLSAAVYDPSQREPQLFATSSVIVQEFAQSYNDNGFSWCRDRFNATKPTIYRETSDGELFTDNVITSEA